MQNLIGLILPVVIDFINKNIKDSKIRFGVSLAICAVVALVLNIDQFTSGEWGNLLEKISLVFMQAQIVYHTYWQNSQLREKIVPK